MKVITISDSEFSEFEKLLAKLAEDDTEKLELEKELKKQKTINENLERSIEYWKSLYASEKETWMGRYCKAIRKCRDFGLTDSKIKELFDISWVGILDYYLKDMEGK